jgi:predicted dehydrogenase
VSSLSGARIGVAIFGAGRAGMIHARNFASIVPHARVAAISDPVPDMAAKACRELDLDDSLAFPHFQEALSAPGVDAVLIATPTSDHCEIAVAAAHAGKHVFCEKPMAMNVSECDAMMTAAEEAHVVLQIGFMRRFDASFVDAKQRIECGEIGDVVQVKSLTHGPTYPKPWMFDLKKSNGPLAEVNSHDIDTLHCLTGSSITEVYSVAGNYRTPEALAEFPDFYDQILMTARFANGMQGCVSGAQGVQYAYDARCEIIGTEGIICIGSLNGNSMIACGKSKELRRPSMVSWTDLFKDAYLAEDIDFIRCIREGGTPRATGHDGRAAVEVVIAGNLSIAERKPIEL